MWPCPANLYENRASTKPHRGLLSQVRWGASMESIQQTTITCQAQDATLAHPPRPMGPCASHAPSSSSPHARSRHPRPQAPARNPACRPATQSADGGPSGPQHPQKPMKFTYNPASDHMPPPRQAGPQARACARRWAGNGADGALSFDRGYGRHIF